MTQKSPLQAHKQFLLLMKRLHKKGFTFVRVAQELGVHERTIYKWTYGERKVGPLVLLSMEKIAADHGA